MNWISARSSRAPAPVKQMKPLPLSFVARSASKRFRLRAKRDMVQDQEIELWFLAPTPHYRIVGRGGADRHVGAR